jgi:hypothetical protein
MPVKVTPLTGRCRARVRADAFFDEIQNLVEPAERPHMEVRTGLISHGRRGVARTARPTKNINLLLPMALAGGGELTTMPVTQHFESHVETIGKFLERKIVTESKDDFVRVRIS